MPAVLGLDIGGANLKAAHSAGLARCLPFALWKHPTRLESELTSLIDQMPRADIVAATMTGELCDCFASKREGVAWILASLEHAARTPATQVWLTDGRFVAFTTARQHPLLAASSNWHALATFAGRFAPHGPALLVDVGSTTSDIIPLLDGQPVPCGHTDPERLNSQELVYTGVSRTPLTTLMGERGAAELFATTEDIYLILGDLGEQPAAFDTADGRAATQALAHARLARMLCADLETSTSEQRFQLAQDLAAQQTRQLTKAIQTVSQRLPAPPEQVILAGSGAFLAERAVKAALGQRTLIQLAERLGEAVSVAACAHAVALLALERHGNGSRVCC